MSRRVQQDGSDGSDFIELRAFHGDSSSQLYQYFHDSSQLDTHHPDLSLLQPTSSSKQRAESLLSNRKSTDANPPHSHGMSDEITDEAEVPLVRASRKQRYRFKSWKIGVASAAVMTTAVLITNSAFALWGYLQFTLVDGIGTAIEGSCDKVNNWNFGLHIAINILSSAMLMSATAREATLVTSGDAISNWLENPDDTTAGYCIENRYSLTHKLDVRLISLQGRPQGIEKRERRWRDAVSYLRWSVTITILSLILAGSIGCFAAVIVQMKANTAESIISLGFGTADPRMLLTIADATPGLARSVLLANLPQLLLSLVYFSLNTLFTAMHLARECNGYQLQRRPLRVTTPRGQQRKTYWLQLPFTYGIPLVATSAALHWLISQSIFLVQFDIYRNGLQDDEPISSVGLSPAPMLAIVIAGACIILAIIGIGSSKLQGQGMPVSGSCSFALSAAAHRPTEDVDAAFLPVKWGELVQTVNDAVGHCCFTSQEVVDVAPGRLYAGTAGKES